METKKRDLKQIGKDETLKGVKTNSKNRNLISILDSLGIKYTEIGQGGIFKTLDDGVGN